MAFLKTLLAFCSLVQWPQHASNSILPIICVIIRKVECARSSIIPIVWYWNERIVYAQLLAHEPVPSIVFSNLLVRFNSVNEPVRIVPHSIKTRRKISDEAMIVIRGLTNGRSGQGKKCSKNRVIISTPNYITYNNFTLV